MADDIDQWLDELAGRESGDELTEALRRAVAKREGPATARGRGPTPALGDLGLKRLHRRLADEGLLEPNPIHRLFRPTTPAWLPAAGLTATILLAFSLSLLKPGIEQRRPLTDSPELAQQSGFAADMSAPASARLMSPQAESDSRAASFAAPSAASQKRVSQAFTACSRNAEGLLQVDIAVDNIAELRAHYARLNAIDGVGLRFDARRKHSRLLWSSDEAGARLASVLESAYAIRCELDGERALALHFSPTPVDAQGENGD